MNSALDSKPPWENIFSDGAAKSCIQDLMRLARQEAGISLHSGNMEFIRARLAPRVATSADGDLHRYLDILGTSSQERQRFVESLTVHTTSFFREQDQYDWLIAEGLPALVEERSELLFWSAACSAGQEGWSALMAAVDFRNRASRPFKVCLVGTDISRRVLAKAGRAVYSDTEMSGIPLRLRQEFFLRARDGSGMHRVVPELRRLAKWQRMNLADGTTNGPAGVDVAFLRNVLIYFDAEIQAKVIDRLVKRLRPGGYLFTGHSEGGISHPLLKGVRPTIFTRMEG